eukprot:gene9058-6356_t
MSDGNLLLSQEKIWRPTRQSPMLMNRTVSCRRMQQTHSTIGVVGRTLRLRSGVEAEHSPREERQEARLGFVRCHTDCWEEREMSNRALTNRRDPMQTCSLQRLPPSLQPGSRRLRCHQLYVDAPAVWRIEKKVKALPYVFQQPTEVRLEKKFWRVRELILRYREAKKFIRAFELSRRWVAPSKITLQLETFSTILQSTVQSVLEYAEVYFVFSLLSDKERKALLVESLPSTLPTLFAPPKTFNTLACKHIALESWPSYMIITLEEVVELLDGVDAFFNDRKPKISFYTNEVVSFLRLLGFVNEIPLQTLHNVIAGSAGLMEALHSFSIMVSCYYIYIFPFSFLHLCAVEVEVDPNPTNGTKDGKDLSFGTMLRRQSALPKAVVSSCALLQALRTAHHKPTVHDWSNIWSKTPSVEEQAAINSQAHRTVSAVVPGELFMRHWIAAEQSTMSVANRVISGMIIVVGMVWAAGYATLGYNSHNSAHVAGWFFLALFFTILHTHNLLMGLGAPHIVIEIGWVVKQNTNKRIFRTFSVGSIKNHQPDLTILPRLIRDNVSYHIHEQLILFDQLMKNVGVWVLARAHSLRLIQEEAIIVVLNNSNSSCLLTNCYFVRTILHTTIGQVHFFTILFIGSTKLFHFTFSVYYYYHIYLLIIIPNTIIYLFLFPA